MDVTVKFFSIYREAVGAKEVRRTLEEGSRVRDLLEALFADHPKLAAVKDAMLLSVNQEFTDEGAVLRDGDEVALLPPVSGGTVRIQSDPLSVDAAIQAVRNVRAGAVVVFLGTVRSDPGIEGLDYEVYEGMAERQMAAVRTEAMAKFDLVEMAIAHRTGLVPLGDVAVVVAASAPHRREAFAACEWAMDRIKRIVPIWKEARIE
jgi:molybdopterin synthase catalytic subunit